MIAFRVDCNNKIGGGHLNRCISLANEILLAKIKFIFILDDSSSQYAFDLLQKLNYQYHIIPSNKRYAPSAYLEIVSKNSLVVFDTDDHNYYSGDLIEALRCNFIKTACFSISDKHPVSTDVLINPNIISQKHNYSLSEYTETLLGPQHMIFSKNFRTLTIKKKPLQNSLLIIFGNADPQSLTLFFLEFTEFFKTIFTNITVVVGALNKDIEAIKATCKEENIEIHINTSDMVSIYEKTTAIISSAGMTMWEAALYEIPQVIVPSSGRELEYTIYLSDLSYISYFPQSLCLESKSDIKHKLSSYLSQSNTKLLEFKNEINPKGIQTIIDKLISLLNR